MGSLAQGGWDDSTLPSGFSTEISVANLHSAPARGLLPLNPNPRCNEMIS